MRLFVALDIDSGIRQQIAEFSAQMRAIAPNVRWVGSETFHVTLQFLGETRKLDEIQGALRPVKGSPVNLRFRNAGFFPTPKAPRVFWVGIEAGEPLQELVTAIGQALKPFGFKRDAAPYTPHLTLARSGGGHPRPVRGERATNALQQVRTKLETMSPPEFGTMTAREFYLYESKVSPAGAKYTKLARYPLE
jgi:2'-5' RNA ligase